MFAWFFNLISKIFGRNNKFTPVETVLMQMKEPRPLPIGMTEFEEWSDRIISGTLLPADPDSQKFALANQLLHLGPTESHKEDIYFIKTLRKFAVNQIADAKRHEIQARVKSRLAEEEKKTDAITNNSCQVNPTSEIRQH